MNLYKNKYRTESTRWQQWDYSNEAAYFITICIHNKLHYFGEIENDRMFLNKTGCTAQRFWLAIPGSFSIYTIRCICNYAKPYAWGFDY